MKLNRKKDLKKCGIYCIRNTINNKVYIGKSINIYNRVKQHVTMLNRKIKTQENQHLINAWHKYGKDAFEYIVLEYININTENLEDCLRKRELYWIDKYSSKQKGYNIRYDSYTNCIVNSLTRKQQSENLKKRWKEDREQMCEYLKNNWKNKTHEEMEAMKDALSKSRSKYWFRGIPKDKKSFTVLDIKKYDSMRDLLKDNPTYKRHNIYAVCSGEKPSMYGYIWSKILKEDIVQS